MKVYLINYLIIVSIVWYLYDDYLVYVFEILGIVLLYFFMIYILFIYIFFGLIDIVKII